MEGEKHTASHVDAIERAPSDNAPSDGVPSNSDEEIIRHLETTGETIGMTWRTILAASSMGMCYNAYLFTLLIPPAILGAINADLGPDPRYTWITISWNLGGAMFVTVGGRLSDIFGRRYFFLTGAVMLIIGSIICATGQSINQMIAGGAIFGAGSGFLEMAFGAVQEIVPNEWRMATIGLFDASSVIAQIMPLVAWVMIKNTHSWRNAYYLMIGFQCLNVAFLFFFYHPPTFKTKHRADGKTRGELLREFDWLGLFLFIAGCTLFIVGVNWGGTLYPWTSATTLAPIIVGFMTLVGLGFYERYADLKEPLLPPRLFKQVRHFTMPMVVMAVAGMQYYSNATLWNRLSQLLYASDEISKGLYAEVLPLGSVLGGIIIVGSKKLGHQRWQVFGAVALQTACVGALSTATLDNPTKSIILTFFVSLCTSLVILNSLVLIGFGIVYQEDIGTAAGLAGTSRLLAGAVATAIFSNVTNNKYADQLTQRVMENISGLGFNMENIGALVKAARLNTPVAYQTVPGLTPEIQAAATYGNKEAYLDGAHLSYQVALAFGLCGCICALFIPSIDERKYTKKTVALQEEDRKAVEDKKLQTGA
ncbi:MFS general substrate transporter [Patellaria atrata CBS 101060]|uniref:MFS general substrate transporter n=1 Tax=Patellaria atrata CBS 101060 TaxID=1346257 RepID=A0A9P4S6K1_9PEZI|nr:MFS general substrate transporter [Patellaria atrata CBS 101060]